MSSCHPQSECMWQGGCCPLTPPEARRRCSFLAKANLGLVEKLAGVWGAGKRGEAWGIEIAAAIAAYAGSDEERATAWGTGDWEEVSGVGISGASAACACLVGERAGVWGAGERGEVTGIEIAAAIAA